MSDATAQSGKAAFNAASETTLRRALAVSDQRGGEYLDSWHVDNQVSTFIEHVLRLPVVPGREREYRRLIMVAALIDVKDSRMGGPWKLDTVDDSINYRGAFATWREEYDAYIRLDALPNPVGNHAPTLAYERIARAEYEKCRATCSNFSEAAVCCGAPNSEIPEYIEGTDVMTWS